MKHLLTSPRKPTASGAGQFTPAELATRTGTAKRYVLRGAVCRRTKVDRGIPNGRGIGGMSTIRVSSRTLPARLQCQPGEHVDLGAGRRAGEITARGEDRRHRMRSQHINDRDGEGIPLILEARP